MSGTLAQYIAEAHKAGLTLPDIARELSAAGWTAGDLAAALRPVPTSGVGAAHNDEPVIVVRDLVKRYGELTAVNGVSFTVRRGEIFGILGPNGAGKTTTLEMIEGVRRPSAGSITVDGLDVLTQTHAVKAIIGVQPQSSAFFDGLNLRETLELFAAFYGCRVDPIALLAEVQLAEKAGSMVKELSGGQRQRFSIAVGLVNDPTVLFLDEPTTGLDPQARRNLWDLVRQINARGTTIVLTTHYMDEAEVLCERVAIMDGGTILTMDSPRALIRSLLDGGFSKPVVQEQANLEDVFLHMTGHDLRE